MGLVGITAVNGPERCPAGLPRSLRCGCALRLNYQTPKAVGAHVVPTRFAFFRRSLHDIWMDGARAQQLDEQGSDGGIVHTTMLPDHRSARQHSRFYRQDGMIRPFLVAITE